MTADKYRQRTTAEIVEEQQEIAALRRAAVMHKLSWWSWDRESYQFSVSKSWEDMSGIEQSSQFPELSPDVPIEGLLDNIVDRWMDLVVPEEKRRVKRAAENFLSMNAKSSSFDMIYNIRGAQGKVTKIISRGRSVWNKGKLQSVFVCVCEPSASTEIQEAVAANADAVKTTQKSVSQLKTKLSAWAAIALTIYIGFNDFAEKMQAEFNRTIRIFSRQATPARYPGDSEFVSSSVTDGDLVLAEDILLRTRLDGVKRATVVAYSVGRFPTHFKTIVEVSYGHEPPASNWTVREVSESTQATAKTDAHISTQPFLGNVDDDGMFVYSVPFLVKLPGDRVQIFYVEVLANPRSGASIEDIEAFVLEASAKMNEVF